MADIQMPQLGETVTEGTITKWFKQVGDQVAEDEPLFEVSTDKVDSEVPSPISGVVSEILVEEGDTVDVGAVLARVGDAPAGDASGGAEAPAEAPAEPEPAPEPAAEPEAEAEAEAFLPASSPWPFLMGVGAFLLANGLIVGGWFALPGAAVLTAGIGGFVRQSRAR
jgi:2-oxoglutarate dehydrogenase E2 component (dihydrolipoamide succinyltransferase)